MVLESLVNPFTLKKRPWEMFIAGFFYSIIALFLSYFVFQEVSGLLMVFLIVISTLPIIYTTVKQEELIDPITFLWNYKEVLTTGKIDYFI